MMLPSSSSPPHPHSKERRDGSYDRVPQDECDSGCEQGLACGPQEEEIQTLKQEIDHDDDELFGRPPAHPLEVDAVQQEPEEEKEDGLFFFLHPPQKQHASFAQIVLILLRLLVTIGLVSPTLVWAMVLTRRLLGRIWPATPFCLHLTLTLGMSYYYNTTLPRHNRISSLQNHPSHGRIHHWQIRQLYHVCCRRALCQPWPLDVVLFGLVYTTVCSVLVEGFFTDYDGTPVVEYKRERRQLLWMRRLAILIAALRLLLDVVVPLLLKSWWWVLLWKQQRRRRRLYLYRHHDSNNDNDNSTHQLEAHLQLNDNDDDDDDNNDNDLSLPPHRSTTTVLLVFTTICIQYARWFLLSLWCAAMVALVWCARSVATHCVSWPAPTQAGPHCDPLDTTECFLPFPSFHHMIPDNATATKWRVRLDGNVLPPLKGGLTMEPSFLNQLDGFSTMGPMLFYLEGLEEVSTAAAVDVVVGDGTLATSTTDNSAAANTSTATVMTSLQGANAIAKSTTVHSVTLLVDVERETLVSHTAEMDHLDDIRKRPLVLVFPAQPLRHNAHYALAVAGATGVDGRRLAPKPGMQALRLFDDDDSGVPSEGEGNNDDSRRHRYKTVLLPALQKAAPWLDLEHDPLSLQLLFDYHTISAASQLGPVRAVRDGTLRTLNSPEWGPWADRVRWIRIDEGDCSSRSSSHEATVARTLHGELQVPWFLQADHRGRGATLQDAAVATGTPVTMGWAKFVVHIPCSLRAAALGTTNATTGLRAVVEFGHGLFYNRAEASEDFLLKMANENGYILTAMDWRGMSSYDLLVVAETLLSRPRDFRFVRDNLIQGYANKLALQHFSRNGMLGLPWFQFRQDGKDEPHSIPIFQGQPPSFVFYGISQGGILGAGYTALSGPTKLIDRSILGSPGTPFALVMSRSLQFQGYDAILLFNFYNNRHVRLLLCLTQMAWDSAEGSGLLAPPVTEPFPPVLIQAGLGDPVVTTISSEALARGFGASILPKSPREIYGLPTVMESHPNQPSEAAPPHVVLTELLYEKEYKSLPLTDEFADWNAVHFCVRKDPHLLDQVAEFINTGQFVDICEIDGCFRSSVHCGEAY